MSTLYLDDLTPGLRFSARPVTVTEAEIIAFARLHDPQPFHTDPVAAEDHVLFRGLAHGGPHGAHDRR